MKILEIISLIILSILLVYVAVFLFLILFKIIKNVVSGKNVEEKDLEDFKNWLFYAVTIAQLEFGRNTSDIKLYSVWDKALDKFPKIASKIDFTQFRKFVDDTKKELLKVVNNNKDIKELIYGDDVENLNEDK